MINEPITLCMKSKFLNKMIMMLVNDDLTNIRGFLWEKTVKKPHNLIKKAP